MKQLLAACLILVSVQARAACQAPNVVVAAGSAAYSSRICAVTSEALPRLSECGLKSTRPVTVEVVPQMAPEAEHCLGVFRCLHDRIEILTPEAFDVKTTERRLYGGITGKALFAAVL